jgi:hypothetical protein
MMISVMHDLFNIEHGYYFTIIIIISMIKQLEENMITAFRTWEQLHQTIHGTDPKKEEADPAIIEQVVGLSQNIKSIFEQNDTLISNFDQYPELDVQKINEEHKQAVQAYKAAVR